MEKQEYFKILLDKYKDNTASGEEVEELFSFLQSEEGALFSDTIVTPSLFDEVPDSFENNPEVQHDLALVFSRIAKQKHAKVYSISFMRLWSSNWFKAACVLFFIGLSVAFYTYQKNVHNISVYSELVLEDANPGAQRAVLTLEDGSLIDLKETEEGIIVNGNNVLYSDGKSLHTDQLQEQALAKSQKLVLSTPKGGQYKLVLSDGTKVWLNSESTLSYPTSFEDNDRKVNLSGEAYFEVAQSKDKKFKVVSDGQVVTVLGTYFNVEAYPNQKSIKTTLLEGRVNVSSDQVGGASRVLNPGEQSEFNHERSNIEVRYVDVDDAVLWKDGVFVFKGKNLKEVMEQLARWYDVDVAYEKTAPMSLELGGRISKNNSLRTVLDALSQTGKIKFEFKNKLITVK